MKFLAVCNVVCAGCILHIGECQMERVKNIEGM